MAVRNLEDLGRFRDECNFDDIDKAKTCPDCGEGLMLPGGSSIEDTDGDGRDGRRVTWYGCNECGYEEGIYI